MGILLGRFLMSYEQLCRIINKQSSKFQNITLESKLSDDLGLSSFDLMVIIVEIEEKSDRQIDVSFLHKNMTVEELLSVINTPEV